MTQPIRRTQETIATKVANGSGLSIWSFTNLTTKALISNVVFVRMAVPRVGSSKRA